MVKFIEKTCWGNNYSTGRALGSRVQPRLKINEQKQAHRRSVATSLTMPRPTPRGCSVGESERLFPPQKFQDTTPGPCGYIVPSSLISGRAKRFGKPEELDVFNTKHLGDTPGPDSYFLEENEVYTASFTSKGHTFGRSPKVLFNEVIDPAHLVGFYEVTNSIHLSKTKNVAAFDGGKKDIYEQVAASH